MGVCGAAQICRGDNNPKNASNMQPRPKSLSSAKDVGFEHDKRHKTQSDSESSIICDTNIHPPMNARQSNSHQAVYSSNSYSDSDHILKNNTNINNIKKPSIQNKSRNSHQIGTTPPPPPTTILNPPKVGISVRKSKKYIPLPDNPASPNIPINPKVKATRSNPVFARERNVIVTSSRDRAYSAELIKEAEHALLEESTINNDKMNTDANVTPWLVTPVATPSNNIPNKISYHNIKNSNSGPVSPIYPLDFPDENKSKIVTGNMNRPGAINHLINTGSMSCVPSQSSATPSKNRHINRYTNMQSNIGHMNGDNININNIYTDTREPNLSMSMGPNLLAPPMNQFPRISSTSSDFTHLVEQDRQRGKSQGNDNIFDEQIDINWRFSHGGSMTDRQYTNNVNTNTAGSSTFNSSSNVPIDRVENGSIHSLTDL